MLYVGLTELTALTRFSSFLMRMKGVYPTVTVQPRLTYLRCSCTRCLQGAWLSQSLKANYREARSNSGGSFPEKPLFALPASYGYECEGEYRLYAPSIEFADQR